MVSREIVVTGGATGIGAAAVARFAAREHRVHVLDVAPLREEFDGQCIQYVPCDLADPESIDRAVETLPSPIGALVNVAGIAGPEPAETVVAVNFLGLRHLTEAMLAGALFDTGASIVNVASSAGRDWPNRQQLVCRLLDTPDFESGLRWLREHASEWRDYPYKFSKQCAAAYTYRATAIGAKHGVRVNCVNPGATETQLSADFKQLIGPDMYDWIGRQVGRHGTPDDIASVIEFLAIGDCAWLNGVEITVDGGYYAGIVGGSIRPAEDAPNPVPHRGPSAARGQ